MSTAQALVLRSKYSGHQNISHVIGHHLLIAEQHVVGAGDHKEGFGLAQRADRSSVSPQPLSSPTGSPDAAKTVLWDTVDQRALSSLPEFFTYRQPVAGADD
jgi:hypothetical protein